MNKKEIRDLIELVALEVINENQRQLQRAKEKELEQYRKKDFLNLFSSTLDLLHFGEDMKKEVDVCYSDLKAHLNKLKQELDNIAKMDSIMAGICFNFLYKDNYFNIKKLEQYFLNIELESELNKNTTAKRKVNKL